MDIFWSDYTSGEGTSFQEKCHSFWVRWSEGDKLAADLAATSAVIIKAVKAKSPGTEPPPPPADWPSKWFGDRGNIVEIDKRRREMQVHQSHIHDSDTSKRCVGWLMRWVGRLQVYLERLLNWSQELSRDSPFWQAVRVKGRARPFPVKYVSPC